MLYKKIDYTVILEWRGYFIPKSLGLIFTAFCIRPVVQNIVAATKTIAIAPKAVKKQSIKDPVEHIYNTKSFKRDELSKFGISPKDFPGLRDKLLKFNILKRGENNSIVLNPQISIDDLKAHLSPTSSLPISFNNTKINQTA